MRWATPYDRATHCTGGPTPGARALMAYILERFGHRGVRSLGIYNCRPVRGGTTTSTHGEGRGTDFGVPTTPGKASPVGVEIVELLGAHGPELGVQLAIHAREIWDAKDPDGRYYGGVAPHWDHVHAELTREAAQTLRLAQIRRICGEAPPGGWVGRPGVVVVDRKPPASRALTGPVISRGLSAQQHTVAVKVVQQRLGITQDGLWGDKTEAAVRAFQRAKGLKVDGIVGAATWAKLPPLRR